MDSNKIVKRPWDVSKMHTVINNSNIDRCHLIIDIIATELHFIFRSDPI